MEIGSKQTSKGVVADKYIIIIISLELIYIPFSWYEGWPGKPLPIGGHGMYCYHMNH